MITRREMQRIRELRLWDQKAKRKAANRHKVRQYRVRQQIRRMWVLKIKYGYLLQAASTTAGIIVAP